MRLPLNAQLHGLIHTSLQSKDTRLLKHLASLHKPARTALQAATVSRTSDTEACTEKIQIHTQKHTQTHPSTQTQISSACASNLHTAAHRCNPVLLVAHLLVCVCQLLHLIETPSPRAILSRPRRCMLQLKENCLNGAGPHGPPYMFTRHNLYLTRGMHSTEFTCVAKRVESCSVPVFLARAYAKP